MQIIQDALNNANMATQAYIDAGNHWYPCGFVYVSVKPARGNLIKVLKELKAGYVSEYGGFKVRIPHSTQSMYAKIEGANAFVNTIQEHFPKHTFAVETSID